SAPRPRPPVPLLSAAVPRLPHLWPRARGAIIPPASPVPSSPSGGSMLPRVVVPLSLALSIGSAPAAAQITPGRPMDTTPWIPAAVEMYVEPVDSSWYTVGGQRHGI